MKLRAFLAAAGVVLGAGALAILFNEDPDVTLGAASCSVRDLDRRDLADGGLSPRYRQLEVPAVIFPDGGIAAIKLNRRDGGVRFELTGRLEDVCDVLEADCTSDPELCLDDGGDPPARAAANRCACRARGQNCRYPNPDGGPIGLPMNFDQTYPPPFAQYNGLGCTRKACVEMAGEQGSSMPVECQ